MHAEANEQPKPLLADRPVTPEEGASHGIVPAMASASRTLRGDLKALAKTIIMVPVIVLILAIIIIMPIFPLITTVVVALLASFDVHILKNEWTMVEYLFIHLIFIFPVPQMFWFFLGSRAKTTQTGGSTEISPRPRSSYSSLLLEYSIQFVLGTIPLALMSYPVIPVSEGQRAAFLETTIFAFSGSVVTLVLGLIL